MINCEAVITSSFHGSIFSIIFNKPCITIYDNSDAKDEAKSIIWAIGDGTSEGGPGSARATATIDCVEAVTGVTPIASGAKIEIKSVTPADKGTGYIVFQVKKGMVITKIVISKKL